MTYEEEQYLAELFEHEECSYCDQGADGHTAEPGPDGGLIAVCDDD